jgi:hypothetical protein
MASPPPLTQFANKYGPRDGRNESGYTPLEYSFPRYISDSERRRIGRKEAFQRDKLFDFTTRELAQLDAISDRELKASNLQNDIHPLLARDRWEKKPPQPSFTRDHLYTLDNGYDGDDGYGLWSSDNAVVWKALEPCLKLASRFLLSMHTLPWVQYLDERPIVAAANERHSLMLSCVGTGGLFHRSELLLGGILAVQFHTMWHLLQIQIELPTIVITSLSLCARTGTSNSAS